MPVNHVLQTVDNTPNICLMKITLPKKVSQLWERKQWSKITMTYQNQVKHQKVMKRNNKAAPYPHIPKQGQFEILGRPNLKQTAPKEVE